MAKLLTFLEDDHTYEIDGEELPSVTELCRFISREIYGEIPQITLDKAAERGTGVHKLTEALDKYGSCECDDDLLPYLEAYVAFRGEHECDWQKIEWATYHPELRYAGCLDRLGMVDGKLSVMDIKTTYTIHTVAVTAQLTLYLMMAQTAGFDVKELYVLQLKKDGYKLKKIEPDYELANACICLHNRLKKKRRKKKDAGE